LPKTIQKRKMRKFLIIASIATFSAAVISCTGAKGDYPGDTYAPDMAYSRAYETYGYNSNDSYNGLKKRGINYTATPPAGTIARGEVYTYHLTADSAGMQQAETLRNPYDTVAASPSLLSEAERLYLVNCGICHGQKLDGNGPLFNGGNGPYPAAPPALVNDAAKAWTDGHMFYVMTYGKGQMGSYASQLHPEQRWWVIKYIRSKQGGGGTTTAATDSTAAATGTATDSTATAQ
jgi:mono/diheme cytochrome c family protein